MWAYALSSCCVQQHGRSSMLLLPPVLANVREDWTRLLLLADQQCNREKDDVLQCPAQLTSYAKTMIYKT
jgi:hypothetical protein